jgi:hypothetical protein
VQHAAKETPLNMRDLRTSCKPLQRMTDHS